MDENRNTGEPDYLGSVGESEWRRLLEQLRLSDGFWLGFLFVWSIGAASSLFGRCESIMRLRGRPVRRLLLKPGAGILTILDELTAPTFDSFGLVWVEALDGHINGGEIPKGSDWNRWDSFLLRANERRDVLRRNLAGGLIFVFPPAVKSRVREAAPDLWSIRSIVLEVPQVIRTSSLAEGPSADRDWNATNLETVESSIDPEFALAEANRRLQMPGVERRSAALALLRAGNGFRKAGQLIDATEAAIRAVDLLSAEDRGNHRDLANAFALLAEIEVDMQDWSAAAQHFRRAIEISRAHPWDEVTRWLVESARVHRRLAKLDLAQRDLEEALNRARDQGRLSTRKRTNDLSVIYDELGDVERLQGHLAKALEYYDAALMIDQRLAEQVPNTTILLRNLSSSWRQVGDARQAQGDIAGSLQAYEQAREIAERLVLAEPQNSRWQQLLGAAWDRMGDARREQGDLIGALQAYEQAAEIAERQSSSDPAATGWQRDLSVSWIKLGDIRRLQDDLSGAARAYEDARRARERLVAGDPENTSLRRDLAVSLERVGSIRRRQGDLEKALLAYESSRAIAERLVVSDPNNTEWQRDLSVCWSHIGDISRDQRDLVGALRAYEHARSITERLVVTDPNNAHWQWDLSVGWLRVGDIRRAQDNPASAYEAYQQAYSIAERLSTINPDNGQWQRNVSVTLNKIGDACLEQKDVAGAHQAYEAALGIVERLVIADPNNVQWQRDLSITWNKLGEIRRAEGNLAGALDAHERARSIAEQLSEGDPSSLERQRDLALLSERVANAKRDLSDAPQGPLKREP